MMIDLIFVRFVGEVPKTTASQCSKLEAVNQPVDVVTNIQLDKPERCRITNSLGVPFMIVIYI